MTPQGDVLPLYRLYLGSGAPPTAIPPEAIRAYLTIFWDGGDDLVVRYDGLHFGQVKIDLSSDEGTLIDLAEGQRLRIAASHRTDDLLVIDVWNAAEAQAKP